MRLDGHTMGTTWSVTYLAAEGGPSPETVERELQAALDAVNASMSTYQDDSEISRFNRLPVGQWQALSEHFYRVLSEALRIGELSEGAYDVTVGPLVNLWGFGPDGPVNGVPAQEEIALQLAAIGQQHLLVDKDQQRLAKQAPVSLDFSSIAKGYGVDQLANYLLTQQISDFLVEVGGEMRLAGNSPRGDSWRIAVERPVAGARAPQVTLALSNIAVATSGDYRNYFEVDGQRYSHSIDPRTGYPVAHDLVSVTVLADSALEADAWATALDVLGGKQALLLANAHNLAVYLIRRQGDELIATYSEAMLPYLPANESSTTEGQSVPERLP
ncbi:FAD:protein FMN transferase [Parahaliea sp. F7430]|uniref:FAD:protein FMN transferase n=1 Tax=Sediminihaliea albiluteola TaxID=2758564 RepID=A0A7W2TUE4_9GAMM|nr:FAD:protein FMN transferase [Sediminihaliea albiluteola]MBA6412118.1 FAD:protein FMN transferase [Sediminihaliea albiluteola]